MNVFVTGGSGVLGSELVTRLVARGHRVTVASRNPRSIDGSQTAVMDLATGAGLEALAGHDTVVHLASDALASRNVDVDGTRRLLEAAIEHGVGHIVGISIVGVDDHPFAYYQAKVAYERLIEESGVPWSLLRATQFHDLIPTFVTRLPAIGFVPVPTGVRLQPVDRAVVAERLVEMVEAGPAGRVPDLGGPEVIPLRVMARDTLRGLGLRRLMLPLPLFGELGVAFRDGRMLTENHRHGLRWSEWIKGLSPLRDRVGRLSMLSAFLLAIIAVFMAVAPGGFHSEVAPFGDLNVHYIRDTATFTLPVIIGLWIAADRRSWRRPVFAIVAIQNGAHLINHLLDLTETNQVWLGYANAVALAALEVALLWMLRATTLTTAPAAIEKKQTVMT